MSDIATEPPVYPALLDDSMTYRAVLYANWIKGDRIKPRAFMRRPPTVTGEERDKKGLSVALSNGRDEGVTCAAEASQFTECAAICRLSVGQIRTVGVEPALDVIQDEPDHANIVGLPPVPPPDIATLEGIAARREAERIGGELAKSAVLVWPMP